MDLKKKLMKCDRCTISPRWMQSDGKVFLQNLYFPVSISSSSRFLFFSVCQPLFTQSCLFKAYCSSIWILSDCDHKDSSFWLSNKHRCMLPDRKYKLVSTNAEYVSFSTWGWYFLPTKWQERKQKNLSLSDRMKLHSCGFMWSGDIIWQFTIPWACFADKHHKWFLSLSFMNRMDYIVALCVSEYSERTY